MTLNQLDTYFNSFLKKEEFAPDPSHNGIQVQNSSPDTKEIKKIAFAVDACLDTIMEAAKIHADMLFVHHGIFWGGCDTITDSHYKRIAGLIKNDIALYAMHLPLDANNPYGNNYGLAKRIGLKNIKPFASWKGMTIGVKGTLSKPVYIEELASRALLQGQKPQAILPFGNKEIRTVGICSGGGGDDYVQAVEEGLDAYITGEVEHELFHPIKEAHINVIAGGHYNTEIVGVNLVAEKLRKEKKIECVFIDRPTGL